MKNEFALRHGKLRMLIGHHCKGPADRWKGKYNQRHEFSNTENKSFLLSTSHLIQLLPNI